jgi:hypothetical protein
MAWRTDEQPESGSFVFVNDEAKGSTACGRYSPMFQPFGGVVGGNAEVAASVDLVELS